MPVVQHDDKGAQENLFFLSVEAKRRADFRGSHFVDDFLSWLNTLRDEEGSWAFHLPVQTEIPGMRLLNGFLHSLLPKRTWEPLSAAATGCLIDRPVTIAAEDSVTPRLNGSSPPA